MATTLANSSNLPLSNPSGSNSLANQAALVQQDNLAPVPNIRAQTAIETGRVTNQAGIQDLFSQPVVKKAMPAIITFITIFVILLVYSWTQDPSLRSLYPGLAEADRQSAFEALEGADFDASIDTKTGDLRVPAGRYHEARLFLAARGLPKSSTIGGIGSLNDSASMTTSQFMEQVRYLSAVEQELAQSISNIATIESARVHLASPKQSVFVRNRTPTKASVVVSPYPGRAVSQSQVQAIIHLVASSVPYLAAGDVSVVDQRGELLTDDSRFSPIKMNTEQMTYKQKLEENYRKRIEALLTPVVGLGNVRSEVEVQLDFTEIESTYEEYDGNDNGPRARSETLSVERGSGNIVMGIPGAASNTEPNSELIAQGEGSAQGPEGSGPMSSTTTRNYEIDRTVRHVKRQGGLLERLSVAVVINSPVKPTVNNNEGADGESVEVNDSDDNEKYSKEQLERFTELVKGAVGYDGQRGDIVTIVSTTFEQQQATPEIIVKWHENDQILGLIKNLSFAIVLICFLFFVIRPMLKTYAKESPTIQESMRQLGLENDGRFSEEELKLAASGKPDALKVLQEKLRPKNPNVSAEMLDTANTYDDKVSLIRLLAADDAKRVANVLKQMISTA